MSARRARRPDQKYFDWVGIAVTSVIVGVLLWLTVLWAHSAASDNAFSRAVGRNDLPAVRALLQSGKTTRRGRERVLASLFAEQGTSPAPGRNGPPPAPERRAVIMLLLESGIDPNSRGDSSAAPLESVISNGDTWSFKALLDHGAKARLDSAASGTLLTLALALQRSEMASTLLARGADPLAPDRSGTKPIALALQGGQYDLAARLIRMGASVNEPVYPGRDTPLMVAAQHNNLPLARLLLDRGARIDAQDAFKTTALIYAAKSGSLPMVRLLLAHGADRAITSLSGDAVSTARKNHHPEVAALIEAGG